MKPLTRTKDRRQQPVRSTRLKVKRMDEFLIGKFGVDSPYYTRSSPKKKGPLPEEKVRTSIRWDDRKTDLFYHLCVEQVNSGKRAGGTLKPEALKKVASEISKAFGVDCTYAQVKNFWNSQKRLWSAMNALRNATGLGLDPLTNCITADDLWWEQACQVHPDVKSLRNKNLDRLIEFGDILFKNVTATGEHVVYPATVTGSQGLAGLTRGLDLNSGPFDLEDGGSYVPVLDEHIAQSHLHSTPASGSTGGSKRKSYEVGSSVKRGKTVVGANLLEKLDNAITAKMEKEAEIPSMEMCWPHLHDIFEVNDELATYGATMLGNNEKQRKIFLGWKSIPQQVRWLKFMFESGYK